MECLELREREKEIDEQKRQLRLLPDLQKQAEAERKEIEMKALEVVALKKQITALEETKLTAIEAERRAAEEAVKKSEELAGEIERIKSEKDAEVKDIQEQLSGLKSKLEKLEQPSWKKLFSAAE